MTQHRDQHQRTISLSVLVSVVASSLMSGIVIGLISRTIFSHRLTKRKQQLTCSTNDDEEYNSNSTLTAYEILIGNTPCIVLPNISRMIQRQIYIKCENYNPSHSGKDRAAYNMIHTAIQEQQLPPPKQQQQQQQEFPSNIKKKELSIVSSTDEACHPHDTILLQVYKQSITGGIIIEGTSGSTGISIAHIAIAKGYGCIVVLPTDQASTEKQQLLQAIVGTYIHIVPPAAISSPNHYVNVAKAMTQRARILGISAIFIDQFNNNQNYQIHYSTTGPEIWDQCHPHAFVMSAGTGGTISGVAKYLKKQSPTCRIVLADPVGSVLFSKIEYGVAYTTQQQERTLLRHRTDSIAEGIGLDRITDNITIGLPYIDTAMTINDQEIVNIAHFILREEGLMIGSSSAINIIAAIQTAQQLPLHSRICTMLCDSGQRHVTRFWNREFIVSRQLSWPQHDTINQHVPECLRHFVSP